MENITSIQNKELNVLILEDSIRDLEIMVAQLSAAGFQLNVSHTKDETGFREALKKKEYDVILSDFKLPGFDAFEALKISLEFCSKVPFICVSGAIGEETAIHLLKKGAVDYVLKDRPERLPFAIKNALIEANEKADLLKAERNLRESEEKFRSLFYNHAAVKLIIDPENGDIVEANKAAVAFYGWSEETLRNMEISQINILSLEELKIEMEAIKKEKKVNFEFQHRKADGSLVDVEVFSSKVEIDGKDFLHSIIHDVTEKKKAEKALIEHEKMLNAMISASPIAIYSIGNDGTVQSWNKASERIFGWTEQEVLGRKLPIVPKHKEKEHKEIVERILAEDSIAEMELTRQKKDGGLIEISLSTALISNEKQQNFSILAIASDITERKEKDNQILLHSTALNSVANAVIITDRSGNVEWVNDAWSKLTGYQEDEVLGGNPRILKSGEQEEAYYEELWDTILKGEVWTGELINRKKDGSLYHELQTITPLLDRDGEVTHLIGIKQDITDQKETEKKLRELVKEKEILLSEVHHRVKNNMAILSAIMYMELIQTENRHLSDNIQKNMNRIDTISSIHELVYESNKWAKIKVEKMLSRIVKFVGQDHAGGCNVPIVIDVHSVFINVNQALPTSLIINEIITGICRTATEEKLAISLTINVSEIQNNIQFTIDATCSECLKNLSEMLESVQKQLITILAEQIAGEITLNRNQIVFKFERNDKAMGAGNHFL